MIDIEKVIEQEGEYHFKEKIYGKELESFYDKTNKKIVIKVGEKDIELEKEEIFLFNKLIKDIEEKSNRCESDIYKLEIPESVERALKRVKIHRIEQLENMTYEGLTMVMGIGKIRAEIIRVALEEKGYSFKKV